MNNLVNQCINQLKINLKEVSKHIFIDQLNQSNIIVTNNLIVIKII